MKAHIDIGFPECTLTCGTVLYANAHTTLGVALCLLAVVGAIGRTIIRLHKHQQEIENQQKTYQEFNDVGTGLANAFSELFVKIPTKDKIFH